MFSRLTLQEDNQGTSVENVELSNTQVAFKPPKEAFDIEHGHQESAWEGFSCPCNCLIKFDKKEIVSTSTYFSLLKEGDKKIIVGTILQQFPNNRKEYNWKFGGNQRFRVKGLNFLGVKICQAFFLKLYSTGITMYRSLIRRIREMEGCPLRFESSRGKWCRSKIKGYTYAQRKIRVNQGHLKCCQCQPHQKGILSIGMQDL
mmetsp:Transcript_31696/g.41892  ORF Transcript_31696/g.41892 Transcript_31696/m.41892 type:complete len:202 (+) Transcript_31696:327-932(+)